MIEYNFKFLSPIVSKTTFRSRYYIQNLSYTYKEENGNFGPFYHMKSWYNKNHNTVNSIHFSLYSESKIIKNLHKKCNVFNKNISVSYYIMYTNLNLIKIIIFFQATNLQKKYATYSLGLKGR